MASGLEEMKGEVRRARRRRNFEQIFQKFRHGRSRRRRRVLNLIIRTFLLCRFRLLRCTLDQSLRVYEGKKRESHFLVRLRVFLDLYVRMPFQGNCGVARSTTTTAQETQSICVRRNKTRGNKIYLYFLFFLLIIPPIFLVIFHFEILILFCVSENCVRVRLDFLSFFLLR